MNEREPRRSGPRRNVTVILGQVNHGERPETLLLLDCGHHVLRYNRTSWRQVECGHCKQALTDAINQLETAVHS